MGKIGPFVVNIGSGLMIGLEFDGVKLIIEGQALESRLNLYESCPLSWATSFLYLFPSLP